MKVRCVDQSVRLRLRKSDISQLLTSGMVQVSLRGPGNFLLTYTLGTHSGSEMIVRQEGTDLQFLLPHSEIKSWAASDTVEIEKEIATTGPALHFLLEKDFPCKDRPDEDKTDFFTELADQTPSNC